MVPVLDDNNDVCPICKTDRYLNANMKFLVNPECYHKICDSCVDRIFSSGPAKCPYEGCDKTLRKNKFKTQIFEDIGVEKEIDIRKRINKTFNKTQKDFKTLEDYNAHLEKIEDIVYNLLNGIDVQKTNEYIEKYKKDNQKAIHQNNLNSKRQHEVFLKSQSDKKIISEELRNLSKSFIKEMQEDKKQVELQKTNALNNSSLDTEVVLENLRRTQRKQMQAKEKKYAEEFKKLQDKLHASGDLDNTGLDYSELGSKQRLKKIMTPFSPFQGDRNMMDLYSVEDEYYDPYSSNIGKDKTYLAGGIRVKQIYEKSLFEAFFGLECIIKEEKA